MVAPNKQRVLTKLLSELAKVYHESLPKELSVLDHLLLGVIQEGASVSKASKALERLLSGFHDLNELRVSHPNELVELLDGIPDAETKSRRILSILQFVFETTYTFDLEAMKRKPLKQAQKQLSKITGANMFTVSATVQRALGGHSLPVDSAMCELLARLDLIGPGEQPEQVRTSLEHLVPKAQGIPFCLLVSELAGDPERQEEILRTIMPKVKPKAPKVEPAVEKPAETPAKPAAKSAAAAKPTSTRKRK